MPIHDAERFLAMHRIMAVATVRPDGWPQNTIVGFAARGLTAYFMVFRDGQKFANITREPRVALAVGAEPKGLLDVKAIYAGAIAREVSGETERSEAWKLLQEAHPNLASYAPDFTSAAIIRADLQHISLVDYSIGLGHRETITVDLPAAAQGTASESDTNMTVEPGASAADSRSRS